METAHSPNVTNENQIFIWPYQNLLTSAKQSPPPPLKIWVCLVLTSYLSVFPKHLIRDRCVWKRTVLRGELSNCAFLMSFNTITKSCLFLLWSIPFDYLLSFVSLLRSFLCGFFLNFIFFIFLFFFFLTLLCVSVVKLSHTPSAMVNQKMVFDPSKAWSLRPARQTALRTEHTEQPAGAGISLSPPALTSKPGRGERSTGMGGHRQPGASSARWEGKEEQQWIIL